LIISSIYPSASSYE